MRGSWLQREPYNSCIFLIPHKVINIITQNNQNYSIPSGLLVDEMYGSLVVDENVAGLWTSCSLVVNENVVYSCG